MNRNAVRILFLASHSCWALSGHMPHVHQISLTVNRITILNYFPNINLCSPVRLHGTNFLLQGYSSESQTWKPVCSDFWNDQYGQATCQQIGYKKWVSLLRNPVFRCGSITLFNTKTCPKAKWLHDHTSKWSRPKGLDLLIRRLPVWFLAMKNPSSPWARHFTLLAWWGMSLYFTVSCWIRASAKWLNVNELHDRSHTVLIMCNSFHKIYKVYSV